MYNFLDIVVIVFVCIGLLLIINIFYIKNVKLVKKLSETNINLHNLKNENIKYKKELDEIKKESQDRKKELDFSEDKLRLISSQLIYTQEGERKRLGRELHDGLGQSLIALKMYFSQLERKIPKNLVELQDICNNIFKFIDNIIEETRRISRGLSPYLLEEIGLSASLEYLLNELTYKNILVSTEIEDVEDSFTYDSKVIIYRIVQEAFSNIMRHSNASHVFLSLKKLDDKITVMIIDDGIGFDVNKLYDDFHKYKNIGIFTMQERAAMIGAYFEINSQVNYGTTITLTLNT